MKRFLITIALFIVAAGVVSANEPITIGETIHLVSKIMGEERVILVSTPPGYRRTDVAYPVLYMTDGATHLTHTRGTVDFLAQNGIMPQVIIVAVANTDRTRDLTPTHASMKNDDGTVREFPTSGGAGTFLDFFEREFIPYIDSTYRTVPFRVFAGHSFGGLFALNALFERPALFSAVLSVSPSLAWDEDFSLRQAAEFFAKREELIATLFVAMANEEEGEPRPNRLDRLEKTVEDAGIQGFEYDFMRMPDENHGTVVLRAHYWGLRKVFYQWNLPRDPESGRYVGNVGDLKAHYAKLSKRYGFEVLAPENTVNGLGYEKLARDEFSGAIEVFRYNVELYPNSANVYDSLGEALERAGRYEEAYANYSNAVDAATASEDERLELFQTNRDRLKNALKDSPGKK